MSKIIKIGGVVLASGLSLSVAAQHKQVKEENTKRPNLLLFIADDWSYPHAGVYGDKTVKTPAFDFVANNGMLFSTALCAAPTSTASRAAILTGKYSHALGGEQVICGAFFLKICQLMQKHWIRMDTV